MNYMEMEDLYSTGVYPKREVMIVRGEGARLWDENGKMYVDCVGGHGSANLGHSNPAIVKAIEEQARTLITCPEVFHNDTRARAMGRLVGIAPVGLNRVFLSNSGTEAIEAAFKFARMATGKTGIIATMRCFHGRTMGALSATWEKKYRETFAPLIPGFKHVPYDNLEAAAEAMDEDTAAMIVELVQGEGGVRPAAAEYITGLRRLCDERGVLLIVDEIQTGFGRTGRMFACEHFGLVPDIMCLAKSIAGGLPMGATLIGPKVQNVQKQSHGSTFGGNPVACAASIAAIDYLESERLPERASELGAYAFERLRELKSANIREVRGMGLMMGIELKDKVTPYLKTLMDRGLLALPAGPNVLRLLPPLVIEKDDLDFAIEQIDAVFS